MVRPLAASRYLSLSSLVVIEDFPFESRVEGLDALIDRWRPHQKWVHAIIGCFFLLNFTFNHFEMLDLKILFTDRSMIESVDPLNPSTDVKRR